MHLSVPKSFLHLGFLMVSMEACPFLAAARSASQSIPGVPDPLRSGNVASAHAVGTKGHCCRRGCGLQAFDELLLLKRGGEVIFSGALGPGSANLTAYFEAIAGVPAYKSGWVA